MKTIPLKHVAQRREGNSTTGEHYAAKCPFCSHRLLLWPDEYEKREIPGDTSNVCHHAEGISPKGDLILREHMSVTAFKNVVRVNGKIINRSMREFYYDMSNVEEEASTHDWIRYPDYAPSRRFAAIWEVTKRVYEADPVRWAKQDLARLEEKERAELARLKAKYETVIAKDCPWSDGPGGSD
jgi:hypothetical protein